MITDLPTPTKYIEANQENLEILQKMSHEFHELYAKVMEEYGNKELKLIDDLLDFGYKIIQVIGIVAGLGFSGISGVKNITLFAVGELFLLSSIAYGVYRTKKIYLNNLGGIQKSGNKVKEVLKAKSDFFVKYINQLTKEGKIEAKAFATELNNVDTNLLKAFETKELNAKKKDDVFLDVLIFLLILGGIFLILSFIDINWFEVIAKIKVGK